MALLNLNPNTIIQEQSDSATSSSNIQRKPIFTKPGIPSMIYKKKAKQVAADLPRMRLLPCFDYSLYGSEAFYSSWVPFKSPDQTSFTQWAIPVKGYTYFGKLWEHFLSPATAQASTSKYADKFTDPIADLSSFIRMSVRNGKTLRDGVTPLITQEELDLASTPRESGKFVVIPMKPRAFLLVNALVENKDNGEWEQKVVILSSQAYKLLTETLETRPGRSDPIVSEAFPDYLFGDITDPNDGCILFPKEEPSDSGINILTLTPSYNKKTLAGHTKMPITEAQLRGRYLLNDTDNVLDIWDYQRILDQMCKDPAIPLETLEKAMEYGGFASHAVLNTDLRQQGIAEVEAMEAAFASYRENQSKVATPNPSFVGIPQRSGVYEKSTTTQPTSNVMQSLQQSAYNSPIPVVPPTPTAVTTQVTPQVTPQVTTASTPNQSRLTPEEQVEFNNLTAMTQTGQGISPADMVRYMDLMRKAQGVA